MYEKTGERARVIALLLTMFYTTAVVGVFFGFMFAVYPHEAGHYLFAYMGNKTAIDKIEFYQTRLLKDFLIGNLSEGFTVRGRVAYKGNIDEIFSGVWIDLVSLGGLAVSLTTLAILIYTLHSINPEKNNLPRAFSFLFVLSFFFGVVLDTYIGWWTDGIKLMKYHNISQGAGHAAILATSALIITGGLYLSYRYLEKFLRFFPPPERFWQELSLPKIFEDLASEKQKKK